MQFFRDCESGGAWPFLVRGVNCLLNCDNGRDLCLATGAAALLPVRAGWCAGQEVGGVLEGGTEAGGRRGRAPGAKGRSE